MGIIRAAIDSIGGGLADSWLEVIEPSEMDMRTVFAPGVSVPQGRNDKRNSNTKGTSNTVSNGSIIHVYEHQMMILVDGGAIVDYTAEPGYFKVDNSSLPSLFNGQFGASVKETFNRIKFGGTTPGVQKVFYINTAEMAGINFGTKTPINYYDGVYDMDLNVRALVNSQSHLQKTHLNSIRRLFQHLLSQIMRLSILATLSTKTTLWSSSMLFSRLLQKFLLIM